MTTQTDEGAAYGDHLKRHTEALIKDIGYALACEVSGKSKATLGRYASLAPENSDRYIPVNVLLELERVCVIAIRHQSPGRASGNEFGIRREQRRFYRSVEH